MHNLLDLERQVPMWLKPEIHIESLRPIKSEIHVEELKPITYGTGQEPEVVPYRLKSNTQIKTVKKKLQELPGSTTNKHGQVVLNFTSKTKSNW